MTYCLLSNKAVIQRGLRLQWRQPTTHSGAAGGNKLQGIIDADSPQLTSQICTIFPLFFLFHLFNVVSVLVRGSLLGNTFLFR